jgi:polyisoprenoid-binding protein YceI
MEVINANSSQLTAAINLEKKTFVFSLPIKSFEGFTGGSLQKQHFNEQYMESDKYPTATFKGSFVTDADLTQNGNHNVKASGNFDIHGVSKSYTITGTLQNTGKQVTLNASFDIRLADHKIDIPTMVTKKLAEVVTVSVSAKLDAK